MKKAELIFVPSPGIGHLVSTLEFAKHLTDRDDRISVTILSMKLAVAPWVDAYTKSLTDSQPRICVIDLPPVDPPLPDVLKKSPEYFISLVVESHLPNVKNIVSSRSNSGSLQVTGLVLDFFCVSMVDIAKELSLPSYMFLTSNMGFLRLMLYLPTRQDRISTVFESSDDELLIPGITSPVPVCVMPSCLFNKDGGHATLVKLAQRFKDVDGIIVNTFHELEPYAVNAFSGDLNPPLYTAGPVLHLKSQPNPDLDEAQYQKIFQWLDDLAESSVVFLCFGSSGSFDVAQVKEIAIGLERSGYNFLWSLRVSSPKDEVSAHRYVTNNGVFPEGFLERIKGRGMIWGWVPQVEILAHKAIGGFVSHCGWNSILESLWYGVPIATWPIYAEQQLNAFRMVKELGLALDLRLDYRVGSDLVMAGDIESAVRCLMDGENKIRKKVKEMAEISRKSLMEGGSSFNSIGQFISLNF
ncbi:Flavonol 3-O-glucosyltransferase UGT71C4 [Citrus sinensis]|uniref:Flavonol 3-O-glucosyltransferase UGT71C4 n=2 Tax=Citrus sinensis TaxID=2711 RepID=A0ACB8JRJ1_CITSI|nr:Flavonol 3-O-glucosyltransferase UGT71C4 [Citrus sinensis]KDO51068.1 hypothetical protein CISIN_1g045570mg [Citrus sinensis]